MAEFRLYVEGIELLVDLTPSWWYPSDPAVRDAVWRTLISEPVANEIVSIDFGIHGIKARCAWPQDQTCESAQEWRRSVLAAFDAMPEAQEAIRSHRKIQAEKELMRKHRRVRFPSRAAIVYGHERAIDPTQPPVLDTEERCPSCPAA